MNDFFLKKIIGDKKAWKEMEARAKALPKDYQVVYGEIKIYIWKRSEKESVDIFKGLLELFEEGAANGRTALEITGNDVAAFCDELSPGAKTYVVICRDFEALVAQLPQAFRRRCRAVVRRRRCCAGCGCTRRCVRSCQLCLAGRRYPARTENAGV